MGCSSYAHFKLNLPELTCALCGKNIKGRKHFSLVLMERQKFSSRYKYTDFCLSLHEECVRKINVKVSDMYSLIKMVKKLEGKPIA